MTSLTPFSQFRKEFFERVGSRIAPLGFVGRLREQAFRKETEIGWWSLRLVFIPRREYCVVAASVGLRVDAVEEMLVPAIPERKRQRTRSATVGAEIGNIADGRWHEWYIRPTDDHDAVADEIVHAFVSFGIPYLERLSDLEALLGALSQDGPAAVFYNPMPSSRCRRAVALALLLGHNDRAEEIATRCRRDLSRKDPGNARLFEMLAERGIDPPS
jgi:hypothetical protein